MKKLRSAANPLIKEAVRIREKRGRFGREAFLVEGPNLVAAAMESRYSSVSRVFATGDFMGRHPRFTKQPGTSKAEILEVADALMKKLSSTEAPQGVVAVASYRPPGMEALSLSGVSVVCDGIQDPGNLGSIIRSADAFGCDAVLLLEGTCDAFSPKALMATAGSVFHVPVIEAARSGLPAFLKKRGLSVFASDPHAGVLIEEAALALPLAMVFGNEAGGIHPEILAASDLRVRIPIPGGAESLNVSVAAAICLYEVWRGTSGRRGASS